MRLAKVARTGGLLPVLALVAVLTLAGCGGGDDSSGTATTATTANDAKSEGGSQSERKADAGGQGAQQGSGPSVPQPNGEPEPGITPEQKRKVTTADITLETPSFKAGTVIPVKYTCDGEDTWPTLRWKGLPPGAAELVLLVLSVRPRYEKLFFNWAVGGLDPSLNEIEEGKLPSDAVVGENSFGKRDYSLCPEPGTSENYIFMLFAIPKALDPKSGFEPRQLREEVLAESGNVGLLSVKYERK